MNRYLNIILFTLSGVVSSQNIDLSISIKQIEDGRYAEALTSIESIDTTSISIENKAKWLYFAGLLYNLNDNQALAYNYLQKSKSLFNLLERPKDVKDCNLQLLKVFKYQENSKVDTQGIINELNEYLSELPEEEDPLVLFEIYREIGSNYLDSHLPIEAKKVFKKSLELSIKTKDSIQVSFDKMNLGSAYQFEKKYDSALYFTKEALPYLLSINDSTVVSYNYNNQALAYQELGDCNKSLEYFKKADSVSLSDNIFKTKIIYYNNISNLYEKCGDCFKALKFLHKRDSLKLLIDNESQNNAIIEAENKYRATEKEKQLLISEKEKERQKYIVITLAGVLSLGSIIAFLLHRNTKRKQHIAEKEREIEIQKTEKLLKEQEITTINAMVEGQEKERQRLASDLHDSVGATLAAAKLQFDHLSQHKEKATEMGDLFDKTSVLLQDAYTEIRSMAHAKNSGVIAKDGLLPAITKLAKTVSVNGGLQIEVTDFGLDDRLENALEITVFRMIQELVTNIVKHADATMATISISKFEDGINIIVEDDGKGFAIKNNQLIDGMGLGSIERRVEFLEGTLEIDSTIHKGTTIVIDIPI